MSVDVLQDKIRKTKNPSMLEISLQISELPPHILAEADCGPKAYAKLCQDLLPALKGIIPAVRVSFASFALLGGDGLCVLQDILKLAKDLGFYICMDAPELLSAQSAAMTADAIFGENSVFPCDGLIISGYAGSDVIKPFLPYCAEGKKDIFVVARTANKSAPELQDLLSGTRLVHAAAADHVNRYGADTAGKRGYTRVGILAGASSAQSLRELRGKYPKLFIIIDGADYPNANAKNCSFAFDKFGHGAVACVGGAVYGAWKQEEGADPIVSAAVAAERMKKNLNRYVTIL